MEIKKKIWPEYFKKILNGEKKVEVRLGDWNCNIGDTLVLEEWDQEKHKYTGRKIEKVISNIFRTKDDDFFSKKDVEKYGYQILSLRDKKSRTGIDNIGVSIAFLCHDGKGNFLFQKRSQNCRDEQGHWDCGGGKLEFGEDFKEAVMRELGEEYSCKGEIQEQFPTRNVLRENNYMKTHWINLSYVVKVNPNEVKNNDRKHIDEIGWFKLSNLPKPLHTAVAERFKLDIDIIKKYDK